MEVKKQQSKTSNRQALVIPRRLTTNHTTTSQSPANITATDTTLLSKTISNLHFTKRKTIMVGFITLLIGIGVAGVLLYRSAVANNLLSQKPSFSTVLPANSSIDQLGGWQRISPPGKEAVFAYADTIGGIAVSVSQQPLPQAFKANTDAEMADLAKKFNATTKIAAGDTTVYVGTSAKGPQSAVFAKNNLLVLIKSQKEIDSAAWAAYAESLR